MPVKFMETIKLLVYAVQFQFLYSNIYIDDLEINELI